MEPNKKILFPVLMLLSTLSLFACSALMELEELSPPQNFRSSVEEVSAGAAQVTLQWQAPAENRGTIGTKYILFRNGSLITETYLTTYTDKEGLRAGATYRYGIVAASPDSLESRMLEIMVKVPLAPLAPQLNPPQNFRASVQVSVSETQITLNWEAPANDGSASITEYKLTRDGKELATIKYPLTTYIDSGVTTMDHGYSNDHDYRIVAIDAEGRTSPWASISTLSFAGRPSPPRNLRAKESEVQISLGWAAPLNSGGRTTDVYSNNWKSADIIEYIVYRNGKELANIKAPLTQYIDGNVTKGQRYSYHVTASNSDGFVSDESPLIKAELKAELPSVPQNFRATPTIERNVILEWDAPADNGGTAIIEYRLTEDGAYPQTILGTTTTYTYKDKGLIPGQRYIYKLIAVNADYEESPSVEVAVLMPKPPPNPPQVFRSIQSIEYVSLRWKSPEENGALITRFKLYRDGTLLPDSTTPFSYHDRAANNPKTTYTYKLVAISSDGKESAAVTTEARLFDQTQVPPGYTKGDSGYIIAKELKIYKEIIGIYNEEYKDLGLTSVEFEVSTKSYSLSILESIGDSAFSGNKLTSIVIPIAVKSIGQSAFANNKFTSVTIPKFLDKIGSQAFAGNPDLETVTLTQYIYNEIKKVHGSVENVFGSQVLVYQDYKGNPLKN